MNFLQCPEASNLRPVTIGNDVWIGDNAVIMFGSTIGDGAVIGANTVVRGIVPPYSINIGNPSRVVGYRFDEAVIARLLEIQWWNWSEDEIDDAMEFFRLTNDPWAFINYADSRTAGGASE